MTIEDKVPHPSGNWNDHKQFYQLIPPKEFSFAETFRYLSRSTNECMHHVENEKITKLIQIKQDYVLIEISGEIDGSICVRFKDTILPSPSVRLLAAHYVWDWFDLDTNLAAFYQMAEQDALLNRVTAHFFGLRNIGIPDLFEALCWGIMGQQINLTFAYTLKRRFVEAFGQCKVFNKVSYWLFPTPEAIVHLKVDDLTAMQLTSKKAEYLIGVAKLMSEGELSKLGLLSLGDCKAAEKELVKIRGIGPWTANYVLMRCLRNPAAFPMDDVGLQNAIKQLLELKNKPSVEELRRLSIHWHNWEAYSTLYLWRLIY
ncbi:MAG: DNA-3-methyladenine glycosylase [Bacilli bacterium]|nr:DNA-3-methyladenine glycosylase [Bacilli bacterium]